MGPSSRSSRPCPDVRYGPQAGSHPALAAYVAAVTRVLEEAAPGDVPARVEAALAPLLAVRDLLTPAQRTSGRTRYRRHVLYADPERRFTVLALVWLPGQTTSVHGHAAWGAVGVYEGEPNVCCYTCRGSVEEGLVPVESSDRRFGPGATCAVQPGYDDTHRIYNGTTRPVITIHTYGCDLIEDPEAINLPLG